MKVKRNLIEITSLEEQLATAKANLLHKNATIEKLIHDHTSLLGQLDAAKAKPPL